MIHRTVTEFSAQNFAVLHSEDLPLAGIKPDHVSMWSNRALIFYALAVHIYNNFDLCLSIYFFLYIKCGSYLLVELITG